MARILIVDDEAAVRALLGDLVCGQGHCADLAANGPEALRMFDPDAHDVVLTDLLMPGMTGLELIEAILRRRADTPIIMITGADVDFSSDTRFTLLRKPLSLDLFYATLDAALARCTAART
jgi:CheY-like chemotaxis protein